MPAALAAARPRPGRCSRAKRGLNNAAALDRLERRLAALEPVAQVRIGRRLVERWAQLDPQIAGLARELAPLVRRRHALLLAVPGCGVITAARLIAEIANIGRFRDRRQARQLRRRRADLDASSGSSSATGSTAPATASSTPRCT